MWYLPSDQILVKCARVGVCERDRDRETEREINRQTNRKREIKGAEMKNI